MTIQHIYILHFFPHLTLYLGDSSVSGYINLLILFFTAV